MRRRHQGKKRQRMCGNRKVMAEREQDKIDKNKTPHEPIRPSHPIPYPSMYSVAPLPLCFPSPFPPQPAVLFFDHRSPASDPLRQLPTPQGSLSLVNRHLTAYFLPVSIFHQSLPPFFFSQQKMASPARKPKPTRKTKQKDK